MGPATELDKGSHGERKVSRGHGSTTEGSRRATPTKVRTGDAAKLGSWARGACEDTWALSGSLSSGALSVSRIKDDADRCKPGDSATRQIGALILAMRAVRRYHGQIRAMMQGMRAERRCRASDTGRRAKSRSQKPSETSNETVTRRSRVTLCILSSDMPMSTADTDALEAFFRTKRGPRALREPTQGAWGDGRLRRRAETALPWRRTVWVCVCGCVRGRVRLYAPPTLGNRARRGRGYRCSRCVCVAEATGRRVRGRGRACVIQHSSGITPLL